MLGSRLCDLGHGIEGSARASETRNLRIRDAAKEPRSGLLTGEAPRWGECPLGGEVAKGVPRRRGISLATPRFCWPVCLLKVPERDVWYCFGFCGEYGDRLMEGSRLRLRKGLGVLKLKRIDSLWFNLGTCVAAQVIAFARDGVVRR